MLRSLLTAVFVLSLAAPAFAGDAEEGAKHFATYCSTCHGEKGAGDGVAAAGLDPKPANFATAEFWKGKDDAYLTKVVKEGGAAVGKSPLMAPWGGVLDDAQIKQVVAFLNTLKPKG
jgi:mono/diheme cytochrome c family protein